MSQSLMFIICLYSFGIVGEKLGGGNCYAWQFIHKDEKK